MIVTPPPDLMKTAAERGTYWQPRAKNRPHNSSRGGAVANVSEEPTMTAAASAAVGDQRAKLQNNTKRIYVAVSFTAALLIGGYFYYRDSK